MWRRFLKFIIKRGTYLSDAELCVKIMQRISHICTGFGITLAQFFCEGNMVELSDDQKELFERWISLTGDQKRVLLDKKRGFSY